MTQEQRREYLLRFLLDETSRYRGVGLPKYEEDQRHLLRSLFNIRAPRPINSEFLAVQDAYLREETSRKGITDAATLPTVPGNPLLAVWQGDIATLKVDGIVNAANSAMLGCFVPNHACIDNAIHTFAGIQLRLDCNALMQEQGHEEATGAAKITKGYNLPSRYVIHTVGPIISGRLTEQDCELLAECYRACLNLALEHQLSSIAFCCISTGEFHFPQDRAAEIAVQTVKDFLRDHSAQMKVIFNVFKESDYDIYSNIFAGR